MLARLVVWGALLLATGASLSIAADPSIRIEQITFGPQHHFFGYIGHVKNIPWNRSGRFIVVLRSTFQDHMPAPHEAADVILIDTQDDYAVRVVDQTRAWNIQQGTMLYWNPLSPETQFFFNDRDPATNKVFCVLFDVSKGPRGQRIAEYRFDDTPIGNSGVAQNGGYFLGLNYGRLARLRLVTGYPGAFDWTAGVDHPADDGVFKVNTATGVKELIVSYKQLADALRPTHPEVDGKALFINHTLWNRDDDRIYFYVRGDFDTRQRLNVPFTISPDGSDLRQQAFIGGHPEWAEGPLMIGSRADRMVLYDTDSQSVVDSIGDPSIFPKVGGDTALSPDGTWIVSGDKTRGANFYVLYRRRDGFHLRTQGFDLRGYTSGDLRCDASPCWNRDGTQVLFPAISNDESGTRQLFIIHLNDSK